VVRAEIDYLAELKLDDAMEIETWITGYRRTSMVLAQRILRTRAGMPAPVVASRSKVVAVWIGQNGRPMRVPPGVEEGMGTPDPT
jgi:acyl-CoA thioesterase FadM